MQSFDLLTWLGDCQGEIAIVSSTIIKVSQIIQVMFNPSQRGGDENILEDKKRPFETSAGTEILQGSQRCFRACQGHTHIYILVSTTFLTIS
jgi:hypothetical protein